MPFYCDRFKILLFFVFVLVLIPGSPSSGQILPVDSNASVREEQDYTFAAGLFKEKQYHLSIQELRRFIVTYPRSLRLSDAYLLLAEAHYATGEYSESIAKFNSFIEYFPGSRFVPSALLKKGLAFARSSDKANARETLRKVLEQYPENPVSGEAAYWLGDLSLGEDDHDNAAKYFSLAYETSESPGIREYSLYSLGWTNQRKKNFTAAIRLYDSTLAIFPSGSLRGQSLIRRAECLFYEGKYADAVSWLTPALDTISSSKERMDVLYVLAESRFYAGEYREALPLYNDLLLLKPSTSVVREVTYALAWSHYNLGHYDSAATFFREIGAGTDAIAHQARYRHAVSLQREGKRREALTVYEGIFTEEEGEYIDNAMFDAALIYLDHLKDPKGEMFLKSLLERYPASELYADASFVVGEQLYKRAQYDSSTTYLREAIDRSLPTTELHRSALLLYAQASLNAGGKDSAAVALQKLVTEYPGTAQASIGTYWLAETEFKRENYTAAIPLFMRSMETDPAKKEDASRGIAWSYYKKGNYPEALRSFQQLIDEFPQGKYLAESRLRLGDVLYASRDFKKAAGQYTSFIRLHRTSPDIVYAQYQLAQSRYRSGEFQQAIQEFNELIRRYPGSDLADDAQYGVGWVWFQTKDYNQAIIAFQRIIKNYPKSELLPRAYYSIGDSYYNNKQFEAAAKSYMEVVYQFPEDPLAMDAVSGAQFSYIAAGKENEALLAVDRFIARNPATPVKEPLLLKQGELLVTLNRYPEAERYYREFIEGNPRSVLLTDALMALGNVLERMSRSGDAAEIYRTVHEKLSLIHI